MFLIVDNTHRKIRNTIKMRMNSALLPFILTDAEHADSFMPCGLIIVTEQYLYKDIKYISDINGKTPVIIWDESDIADFALNAYREIYGIQIFGTANGLIEFDGRNVKFYGKRLRLTPSEKKIVCFLMYSGGWHEKEQIAEFCLRSGRKGTESVPVHICNINNKAELATEAKIIKFRRFSGYSI